MNKIKHCHGLNSSYWKETFGEIVTGHEFNFILEIYPLIFKTIVCSGNIEISIKGFH